MSVELKGDTTIVATRGDTILFQIELRDQEGNIYIPREGDSVRFAMKEDYDDETPILLKDIPIDTLVLRINPEDTKNLPQPSTYVYDISITYADGDVDTFINKAKLKITEEVD